MRGISRREFYVSVIICREGEIDNDFLMYTHDQTKVNNRVSAFYSLHSEEMCKKRFITEKHRNLYHLKL